MCVRSDRPRGRSRTPTPQDSKGGSVPGRTSSVHLYSQQSSSSVVTSQRRISGETHRDELRGRPLGRSVTPTVSLLLPTTRDAPVLDPRQSPGSGESKEGDDQSSHTPRGTQTWGGRARREDVWRGGPFGDRDETGIEGAHGGWEVKVWMGKFPGVSGDKSSRVGNGSTSCVSFNH